MNSELKHIPTNIITGFLGAGKTTAILHLLKHKPENERWAVLVNEFGKIGIDGQLIHNQGAEVKEIPGGCMCCAAGVNMKVGLNALIKQARPHQLLIEPTGIGHPEQILKILSEPPYDVLLDMRACISLLDPRNLKDSRYLNNDNFNQQINIADVLVANKTDQCHQQDRLAFLKLLKDRNKQHSSWVQQGHIEISLLKLPRSTAIHTNNSHHHSHEPLLNNEIHLETGETLKRLENEEDGYRSCGWLFSEQIFDFNALFTLFSELKLDRIKAAVLTTQGATFFNCTGSDISLQKLNNLHQSRIEIISPDIVNWDNIEQKLLNCMKADQ